MLVSFAVLGGFAIGARVSLLWQHTRLMRHVSDDASTRCMPGFVIPWLRDFCSNVVCSHKAVPDFKEKRFLLLPLTY